MTVPQPCGLRNRFLYDDPFYVRVEDDNYDFTKGKDNCRRTVRVLRACIAMEELNVLPRLPGYGVNDTRPWPC
jgi:hypothetical protein